MRSTPFRVNLSTLPRINSLIRLGHTKPAKQTAHALDQPPDREDRDVCEHGRNTRAEGAEVAITGRDQKTLNEAAAELGPKARGYRADLTVAEDRKRLFAALARDFGKLDIVFANAGIAGRTPTGTKGGVVSMARVIAADLAPRKIRVNVVAPGWTKTPIWKRGPRAKASAEESAKQADFYSSVIPLGRWGEPEELAKAVLFLASDDSSYINAVELAVDGGATGAPFGAPILRG